jgi:hypothetical protein
MIRKKHIKFCILTPLIVGFIFSIFSITFYFGDWLRALLVFLIGIFTGALAIPEFEPNAIKKPIFFQTIVGTIGGLLAALAFSATLEYIAYFAIAGAFLGFTANFWLRHMPMP